MAWWWIGNAVLLVVVVPLVVFLANRVIRAAREIDAYAADILEHGVAVTANLDPLPALADTRALVAGAKGHVVRYVTGLKKLL